MYSPLLAKAMYLCTLLSTSPTELPVVDDAPSEPRLWTTRHAEDALPVQSELSGPPLAITVCTKLATSILPVSILIDDRQAACTASSFLMVPSTSERRWRITEI